MLSSETWGYLDNKRKYRLYVFDDILSRDNVSSKVDTKKYWLYKFDECFQVMFEILNTIEIITGFLYLITCYQVIWSDTWRSVNNRKKYLLFVFGDNLSSNTSSSEDNSKNYSLSI